MKKIYGVMGALLATCVFSADGMSRKNGNNGLLQDRKARSPFATVVDNKKDGKDLPKKRSVASFDLSAFGVDNKKDGKGLPKKRSVAPFDPFALDIDDEGFAQGRSIKKMVKVYLRSAVLPHLIFLR